MPTEKRFNTGIVEVNFAEGPENGPPLLLIHGIGGNWQAWNPVIPLLEGSWHTYAMDLRGHGKSGHVADGYHRNEYARDAIALVHTVIKEPAFVVGHSLGALTAVGMAARSPEMVRAAIYEDPPLFVHERWEQNAFADRFQQLLDLKLSGKPRNEMVRELELVNPGQEPGFYADQADRLAALDPNVYRMTLDGRAADRWDAEGLLAQAAVPALLMQGNPELGAALEDDEAERAVSLLPDVQFVKWEDSGHGMHSAFPERFARQVNDFFEGKRGPANRAPDAVQ